MTSHYCQDCERRLLSQYVDHLHAHGITALRCGQCAQASGQAVPPFAPPVRGSTRRLTWQDAR